MQQIFVVSISLFIFCLRPGNSVTEADQNSLQPVANQSASQTLESRTQESGSRSSGQFWRVEKSFSSIKNQSVSWPVIVGGNQSRAGLPALICAPYSDRLTLPGFLLDNQLYSGQISNGKNQFAFRTSVLERGFNQSVAVSQQSSLISVLKDIFRNEGVPHDLVWLAEVESSLNPEAESSAGAVGIFQLMPATAERFGLQLFPDDDRKAPDKSAKAAASYLRQLRNEFGSWALALAAYNAGEGRVGRAMKSNDARTFHEVAPYLPSETQRYVPRVMAIMALRDDQMRGVPSALFMP